MKSILALLLLATPWFSPTNSQAQVVWRVSVKVFTDDNGARPRFRSDASIRSTYDFYNELLWTYARGCQLQVTEIVSLEPTLSGWFDRQPRLYGTILRDAAVLDPGAYLFREDAINVYINNSQAGVCTCTVDGTGTSVAFVGEAGIPDLAMFHEIGHFFGLCHTHGCGCNECSNDPANDCSGPVDDNIEDTIEDFACWNRDQVSHNAFGMAYDQLTPSQQNMVDDVWFNLMSYHDEPFMLDMRTRLTPGQMDWIAQVSNAARSNVATRQFIFVDGTVGNNSNAGRTSADSFETIDAAILGSGAEDVLLMRAGSYGPSGAGPWVLSCRRVLCARDGLVHLTVP